MSLNVFERNFNWFKKSLILPFYFFISIETLSLSLLADEIHEISSKLEFIEEEGFYFKNFFEEIRYGGYIELDGRLFLGPNSSKSTFLVRRARLFMTGTLYHYFGFMLMPRWDRFKDISLHYAWVETLEPNFAKIRLGLFKEPFSLEALTTDTFLNFVERSIVVRTFCQIEDIGIMVFGDLFSGRIDYGLGIFNGRGRKLDNNNNKEIVGRIVYNLLSSARFGRLYLGVSGSTGRKDENLSGFEFVTEEDTPFWRWVDDSYFPVEVHSQHLRWGTDLEWLVGPFYFSAEYLYTNWGHIHKGSRSKLFQGSGGYVECSYLITGEDKPRNAPLFPKRNFDPCKDHWGAWEAAVKYEIFYASKAMIKNHFARGANFLHGPILALNWYPNPRMLMRLDGQYIWFNREVALTSHHFRHETVIVWRGQAFF